MEFCHSYLFVTFVVMTVDQIVMDDEDVYSILFVFFLNFFFFFIVYKDHSMNFATFIY